MINDSDWQAIYLTLKLATFSSIILMIISLPLAYWLAFGRSKLKPIVSALVALPLVLPPSVLGFYLLLLMSGDHAVSKSLAVLGIYPFSFSGLILGSVVFSLPFVVQPLLASFLSISSSTLAVAATLGASRWDRFCSIILPQSKAGIVAAMTLGFAHTIGEFGVVLMIGGNIPGETKVLSVQIYELVETLNYSRAGNLAGGLLIFSFVILWLTYRSFKVDNFVVMKQRESDR